MLRIGMVGEYPTDVDCISSLLMKKYRDQVTFFPLIYDIHGSNLENPKIKHQLRREFQIEKPDLVLFIRDLDGLENNAFLLKQRRDYFTEFNNVVNKKGLLLLNIYELEALLLTDIDKLAKHYNLGLDAIEDCMKITDPKGYLRSKISGYSTGHNKILFDNLDIVRVIDRCRYFKEFEQDFKKNISNN